MAFLKLSNKNKTVSATSSPAHTPRSSMQASYTSTQMKMSQEQVLQKIRKESLPLSINWHV
ncbi:hypothetical protein BGZ73_007431, partial [Actinomortierella ambigua]